MTLQRWLARIERLHPAQIELGLARTRQVAERLGVLSPEVPVVMVAGTNGKGSTSTLVERIARHAGHRTGLYTSPHLLRFNERVRLDGVPVPDEVLCRAFERVDAARGDTPLTYFEFTTLAALVVFAHAPLDILILEVGLGGRLDAVNVVDADVAIVTSVGLDHTDWLGESIELIALEKAGIRRPGRPLIWGDRELPPEVLALCQAEGVPVLRADLDFGVVGDRIYWRSQGGEGSLIAERVPLGQDNLAAATQALACLNLLPVAADIASEAVCAGLPGRSQALRVDEADWFLDVGHNTEALTRFLARLPPHEGRQVAVVAMLSDKPASRALAGFVPVVDCWYLAGLGGTRGRSADELRAALPADVQAEQFADVATAVATARQQARAGDRVLVFGSFHTVAETARALGVELE